MTKRLLDIFLTLPILLFLFPFMIAIGFAIKIVSRGPIIFWSKRVGKDGRHFMMPKFRTMSNDAPLLASHLISDPRDYIFPFGSFLRKTSLDELPQLFLILYGTMSIVGPRPALWNQYDLILMRENNGLNKLKPGITGWAQINGRDRISLKQKVDLDKYYSLNKNVYFDLKIIFMTISYIIRKKDISH